MLTNRSRAYLASDLTGEVKPQTDSATIEEGPRTPSQGAPAPMGTEGAAKTSTPLDTKNYNPHNSGTQPRNSKAATVTHQQRKAKVSRGRFILGKISKNEAEGKTDQRDAEDKTRCLAEIADFEEYMRTRPEATETNTKRDRSHEASVSDVARDSLAMALVDDLHDDGRLLSEKWSDPSFDSSDMVRGHRVIKCDDSFSRTFLAECIAKIGDAWDGLSIRLVHAKEIPRRPRARIWLPKEQTDQGKVLSLLRAQNPEVHTEDWAILKEEKEMKTSQPFLFLINQRCLPQLEKADYTIRYGLRKAKIKVFLAEPDDVLEEVDDTNKLLDDLVIDDKTPDHTGSSSCQVRGGGGVIDGDSLILHGP
ncbi:uncharacterized protein [Drosophila takahashii]|uniref:uncharacterized protein n=1 Tax=Drosophila takahashii TaxID=29030 RepID=UPI003899082B